MLCFRLFSENNPAVPLAEAVAQLREGQAPKDLYAVEPASFQQIPNAPFAYWVSERIRRLFVELPAFEGEGRTVRQGLATADDFRFVRTAWEPPLVGGIRNREGWVLFAKGGSYATFYSDVHMKINFTKRAEELGAFKGSVLRNPQFYFKPGLTWSLRSQIGLGMRVIPSECVFGHKGPLATADPKELQSLLALCTSSSFRGLVALQISFGAYEVGAISRTAIPDRMPKDLAKQIGDKARTAWSVKRNPDDSNLVSHAFQSPALAPCRLGRQ